MLDKARSLKKPLFLRIQNTIVFFCVLSLCMVPFHSFILLVAFSHGLCLPIPSVVLTPFPSVILPRALVVLSDVPMRFSWLSISQLFLSQTVSRPVKRARTCPHPQLISVWFTRAYCCKRTTACECLCVLTDLGLFLFGIADVTPSFCYDSGSRRSFVS